MACAARGGLLIASDAFLRRQRGKWVERHRRRTRDGMRAIEEVRARHFGGVRPTLLLGSRCSRCLPTVKPTVTSARSHLKDAADRPSRREDWCHNVQGILGALRKLQFGSTDSDRVSIRVTIVRWAGIGAAFLVLPFVALADAGAMIALPILMVVRIGKTAESAVDYSLNNTVRNMLWLPTSRRAKYLAKQATDTFFVRMGDIMSAAIVFTGTGSSGFPSGFCGHHGVSFLAGLAAKAILQERARLSSI